MSIQLIIAALIAAAGFGSAWQIQSWRMDAKEKDYVDQALANERSAAKTAIRRSETVIEAQSAATTRAVGLRRDADGARTALVGLSHAADAALQAGAASLDACTVRAATLSELFVASATEYESLAGKASRHASDVQTLKAAWPTNLEH